MIKLFSSNKIYFKHKIQQEVTKLDSRPPRILKDARYIARNFTPAPQENFLEEDL